MGTSLLARSLQPGQRQGVTSGANHVNSRHRYIAQLDFVAHARRTDHHTPAFTVRKSATGATNRNAADATPCRTQKSPARTYRFATCCKEVQTTKCVASSHVHDPKIPNLTASSRLRDHLTLPQRLQLYFSGRYPVYESLVLRATS